MITKNKTNYKHFYQSGYPLIEEVCDIVMEELRNLKRDKRITNEKSYEDLYVNSRGDIYVADTYPVWVEVVDLHGRHEEITYEPDMQNALIVVTKNELSLYA